MGHLLTLIELLFAVCPDPVDQYLEETSVRYISPRGAERCRDSVLHRAPGLCWVCFCLQVASAGACNLLGGFVFIVLFD